MTTVINETNELSPLPSLSCFTRLSAIAAVCVNCQSLSVLFQSHFTVWYCSVTENHLASHSASCISAASQGTLGCAPLRYLKMWLKEGKISDSQIAANLFTSGQVRILDSPYPRTGKSDECFLNSRRVSMVDVFSLSDMGEW